MQCCAACSSLQPVCTVWAMMLKRLYFIVWVVRNGYLYFTPEGGFQILMQGPKRIPWRYCHAASDVTLELYVFACVGRSDITCKREYFWRRASLQPSTLFTSYIPSGHHAALSSCNCSCSPNYSLPLPGAQLECGPEHHAPNRLSERIRRSTIHPQQERMEPRLAGR